MIAYPEDWVLPNDTDNLCLSLFHKRPYISYPRSMQPQLYDQIEKTFNAVGLKPGCVQRVNSKAVTMSLVASGVGFAIVPQSSVKRFKNVVKSAPIKQSLPSVDYYLYCKYIENHEPLKALLKLLKQ